VLACHFVSSFSSTNHFKSKRSHSRSPRPRKICPRRHVCSAAASRRTGGAPGEPWHCKCVVPGFERLKLYNGPFGDCPRAPPVTTSSLREQLGFFLPRGFDHLRCVIAVLRDVAGPAEIEPAELGSRLSFNHRHLTTCRALMSLSVA